jgi:hypothetical protein
MMPPNLREGGVVTMRHLGRAQVVTFVSIALIAASISAATAVPLVFIDYPEQEHWYPPSGITWAAGTAQADPGRTLNVVYCLLYYYTVGDYTYRYWNWTTRTWQIGTTDPGTMRVATGTDSWRVDGGFPTEWPLAWGRTFALYAQARDDWDVRGANVHYFYLGDTTPPTINLNILRPTLSPANGKMVLAAEVSVQDDYDPSPVVSIGVTSNDAQKPPKNGKAKPDWEIVREGEVWRIWLRAENAGRRAVRVYTIAVNATDGAGNTSSATGTVTVP